MTRQDEQRGTAAATPDAPGPARAARVRVLESFRAPRATTNPYLSLLVAAFPEDVEALAFTWPRALVGRWDVLHVHWPEVVVGRNHPVRAAGAALLLALTLVRARLTRRAVVRTAHNVVPHERQPWTTRAVLGLCDRSTTWWVRLNDTTPTPAGAPATTVVHGHYRDWFAGHERSARVPGRLVTVGLVRPYKGVETLLAAFASVADPGLSLRVAGRSASAGLTREITGLAARDARVSLRLEHVPDADLVAEIGQAELVVLPYRRMHNSGAALLALSLDRPVLVPANEVTDALAAEVGPAWVQRFRGELDGAALASALAAVRAAGLGDDAGPDLSGREWDAVGRGHAEVFRAALDRVRRA